MVQQTDSGARLIDSIQGSLVALAEIGGPTAELVLEQTLGDHEGSVREPTAGIRVELR